MIELRVARLEDGARNRGGREGIRPAGIVSKVTDGLESFGLRQAVIQRPGEMTGELPELTYRDQRADRYKAPVARAQIRSQPEITKQNICCVLNEVRRGRTKRLSTERARSASAFSSAGRSCMRAGAN